jgi:hypothetical protein
MLLPAATPDAGIATDIVVPVLLLVVVPIVLTKEISARV